MDRFLREEVQNGTPRARSPGAVGMIWPALSRILACNRRARGASVRVWDSTSDRFLREENQNGTPEECSENVPRWPKMDRFLREEGQNGTRRVRRQKQIGLMSATSMHTGCRFTHFAVCPRYTRSHMLSADIRKPQPNLGELDLGGCGIAPRVPLVHGCVRDCQTLTHCEIDGLTRPDTTPTLLR